MDGGSLLACHKAQNTRLLLWNGSAILQLLWKHLRHAQLFLQLKYLKAEAIL